MNMEIEAMSSPRICQESPSPPSIIDKIYHIADHGSEPTTICDKLYKETGPLASGLVVVALAHALALFSAVASSINISGGHVNPAVTFGSLVGGRISVIRAVYYWVAQLLGSIVAALLVEACHQWHGFHVQSGVGEVHGLLLEMALTFGVVYTVYATALDPKRGSLGIIAPLAIGFIVGANILVGGPFDGASMNPARAFGPALIGWRW
ncbi:hypothetical protein D5086_031322 [Populus alba]|uniref:Aquaporin TIP-type alpha family protein n=2 Tax=Populus alba TaxID=43335 RepID=A0A4U5NN11_POPAL|nr:aquaporin TIP-type alpha family protein [Populus alba]